jgi:hypothetical protein
MMLLLLPLGMSKKCWVVPVVLSVRRADGQLMWATVLLILLILY